MTSYRDDPRFDRSVYQPAEDSELLLEVARGIVEPGWTVIETGVGSGFVANRLRADRGVRVIGTDINPHACRAARDAGVGTVSGSLLDPIGTDAVDAALFNPPYLPSDARLEPTWLERAVDGGPTGIELLDRWVRDLPRVVRSGGTGAFVVSSRTGIDRAIRAVEDRGLEPAVAAERRISFERLAGISLQL